VAYYDPGIGTFSSPGTWSPPARLISRYEGLMFGAGQRENLGQAYSYSMQRGSHPIRLHGWPVCSQAKL
jgi:uncharacterized protein (DUF2235 family)